MGSDSRRARTGAIPSQTLREVRRCDDACCFRSPPSGLSLSSTGVHVGVVPFWAICSPAQTYRRTMQPVATGQHAAVGHTRSRHCGFDITVPNVRPLHCAGNRRLPLLPRCKGKLRCRSPTTPMVRFVNPIGKVRASIALQRALLRRGCHVTWRIRSASCRRPATARYPWPAPRLGSPPPTCEPRLGSPLLQLHRDWAHRCHICTETGRALPHLHRDMVHFLLDVAPWARAGTAL